VPRRFRKPYPVEFKEQIVSLHRAGRSINSLAREFEPSSEAIRAWIKQAEADNGLRADVMSTAERDELRRLRKENKQLRVEREILAKAAAWFARETVPPKSSNS